MAEWKNEHDYWNDLRQSVQLCIDETVTEHGRFYPGDGEYDGENLQELCRDTVVNELADNYCIYYWTTRQIILYSSHVDAYDTEEGGDIVDLNALQLIGLIAYHAIRADLEEILDMNDDYNALQEKNNA